MMEFVDCEDCGRQGKWEEVAPNKFICACGSEVETTPVPARKGRPVMADERKKPKVDLGCISGPEGNAYCIMGRCQLAAKRAGWLQAEVDAAMAR
jgi:hypothetical protein